MLWLAYRLYPYVPTIDLHKYWDALKPVVFHPRPTGYDLFRYTAIWLTVGSLIESFGGRRRGWLLFPLFIAAVLSAKVVIVGKTLSAAEIGGAAIALAVWLLLAISVSARIRVDRHCPAVLRLYPSRAAGAVPVQRLRPGVRLDTIPQLSVRLGRGQHNVLSRKGLSLRRPDMVARKSGLRSGVSTILVAIMLFAASWAETYLPGRSAEITDALMALLIGIIIAVVKTPTEGSRKGTA